MLYAKSTSRAIVVATLVSALLHVLAMLGVPKQTVTDAVPPRLSAKHSALEIQLLTNAPLSAESKGSPTRASARPKSLLVQPVAGVVDLEPSAPLSEPKQHVVGEPDEGGKPLLIDTSSLDSVAKSFGAYVQLPCNVRERATMALDCESGVIESPAEKQSAWRVRFDDNVGGTRGFRGDMALAAGIRSRADTIQALDVADRHQQALVAEQKQHLLAQARRLEESYLEANLLRLIPVTNKLVQALRATAEASD